MWKEDNLRTGKKFTRTDGWELLIKDHKPMDMVLRKPLSQASKRLQALIIRLNRYDIVLQYVLEAKLVLADTLSKVVPDQDSTLKHTRVMQLDTFEMIADERQKQIKEATATDTELQSLLHVIPNGWPDDKITSLKTLTLFLLYEIY